MQAAREWKATRRPVPAIGHMPFIGHRTIEQQTINEWRSAAIAVLPKVDLDEAEPCPGCGDPDCDFDCDGEYR